MDINDFRGIITAVTMLAFVALCALAWNRHRKADDDAASRLPLEEDDYITDNTRENA